MCVDDFPAVLLYLFRKLGLLILTRATSNVNLFSVPQPWKSAVIKS